jgi:hypothetical protein
MPFDDLVARLRRLPRQQNETWQGGPVRLPLWARPTPGADPVRPWTVCFANAVRSELPPDATPVADRAAITTEAALATLVAFAESFRPQGRRPVGLRTTDAEFAAAAREALAAAEIAVEVVERTPFVEDAIRRAAPNDGRDERAGLLAAKGMTVERVRGFADAVAAFHAAAPWTRIDATDLVRVREPGDAGSRLFAVIGLSGGRFHLRSVGSRDHFLGDEDDGDHWSLAIVPPWDAPIPDSELWDRAALPRLSGDLRPDLLLERADGRLRGPGARDVVFFEGLLRTLAAATTEELDSGRFERTVTTSDGPRRFVCELPDVLEAPAPNRGLPPVDDACQAFGRTRRARLAAILVRDPQHVDALHALALATADDVEAAELLRRAIAALEKTIGRPRLAVLERQGDARADDDGDRLVVLYDDLGQALERTDPAGAETAFRRTLQLDPGDLALVRHRLVGLLLDAGRDADAAKELAEIDSETAFAKYARALLEFKRRGGDAREAVEAGGAAYLANPEATDALGGEPGDPPPEFSPGDADEAAWIGARLGAAYQATEGALPWLFRTADAIDDADAATDPEGG